MALSYLRNLQGVGSNAAKKVLVVSKTDKIWIFFFTWFKLTVENFIVHVRPKVCFLLIFWEANLPPISLNCARITHNDLAKEFGDN